MRRSTVPWRRSIFLAMFLWLWFDLFGAHASDLDRQGINLHHNRAERAGRGPTQLPPPPRAVRAEMYPKLLRQRNGPVRPRPQLRVSSLTGLARWNWPEC